MPPLRERLEDVGVLAESVLVRLATRAGLPVTPRLSSVTLRYLQSYGFPGNVRELENILERALAFSNGEVVNVEDLGLRPAGREASENEPADEIGGADEDRDEADAKGVAAQAGGRAAALEGAGGGMDAAGGRPRPVDASVAPKLSDDGIPESLPDYLDAVERDAILRALERTRHNRTAAARLLGISFRALRYRMQRLGIG